MGRSQPESWQGTEDMELEMKDSTGEVSEMRPIDVCGRRGREDAQGGDMGLVGKGSSPQMAAITGGANSGHHARASPQRGLLATAFPASALVCTVPTGPPLRGLGPKCALTNVPLNPSLHFMSP